MADLTGQRLGQYLILERIAKGSTSTVYKAYQEKLERYVAVKVLSPHFIDEEGFLERFKREARAVARLDHSNILPIYDFDHVGDIVYIVMKYVDSGSLKSKMGRVMDLRIVLEIFYQVGYALGYAHRQGVIHRDVKPGNILLGEGNWALLTDFGLAKIRVGDRKLTKSGIGMGTPDYMAPEQAQGLPVDGRADIYSLGCMLYEMVTGHVPFDAESGMAVIVKHITEPPPPPREFNANLPLAVEKVIMRSLAKDANLRYQTAEAMVTDLARAVGNADLVPMSNEILIDSGIDLPARVTPPYGVDVRDRIKLSDRLRAGWLKLRESVSALLQRLRPAIAAAVAAFVALSKRIGRAIRSAFARLFASIKAGVDGLAARIEARSVALEQQTAQRTVKAPAKTSGRASNKKTVVSTRAKSTTRSAASSRSATRTARRTRTSSRKQTPQVRPISGALTDRFQAATTLARERFDRRQLLLLLFGLLVLFVLVALVIFPPTNSPISDAEALRTLEAAQTIEPTAEPTSTLEASAEETEAPEMVVLIESTPTPDPAVDATATIVTTPLPEAPAGMVTVSGGTYKMGATQGEFNGDETPPHFVTVSPFYIDTVEVTIAQFARFAASSGYKTSAERAGNASTWRDFNTTDRQRQPVRRTSWTDATRYCAWVGKRLPTEAEWELAARGRSERIYPWGDGFDGSRANTKESGANQPLDIASLGNRSVYGAYDMVGNVWEWVNDWYGGNYYANSSSSNPRGPSGGSERVIRGGSFTTRAERATTTARGKANPDGWSDDIGFRCAKDIPQPEG